MLDIHIWPWFERMDDNIIGGVDISEAKFPKLAAWMANMKYHPTIQATILPGEVHKKFFVSFLNKTPDYDIGL